MRLTMKEAMRRADSNKVSYEIDWYCWKFGDTIWITSSQVAPRCDALLIYRTDDENNGQPRVSHD